MVSRLKTLVTGLALAEVLDLLVNKQGRRLTNCPTDGVHLTCRDFERRTQSWNICSV